MDWTNFVSDKKGYQYGSPRVVLTGGVGKWLYGMIVLVIYHKKNKEN